MPESTLILLSLVPEQCSIAEKNEWEEAGRNFSKKKKKTFSKTTADLRIVTVANHLYLISFCLQFPTKTQKFPYKTY